MPKTPTDPATDECDELPAQCESQCWMQDAEKCSVRCMNCRREVEASLSRIGGRQLRKLRAREECSPEKCVEFLRGIADESLRLHLASMAWWRFSAEKGGAAEPMRQVMEECRARTIGSGTEYMHSAIRALSPLSQHQLSAWFGCDTLYGIVSLFSDDIPEMIGVHCNKCRLYKMGCTDYYRIGADDCQHWHDQFVQKTAAAVKKDGGHWRNPCGGITEGEMA